MAITLLVAGSEADEPVVGPEVAARLGDLGVTRIALLHDPSGIGVVLEGWAFDPAQVDEAVRAIFPAARSGVRIFHEIEHVAVAAPVDRRKRWTSRNSGAPGAPSSASSSRRPRSER